MNYFHKHGVYFQIKIINGHLDETALEAELITLTTVSVLMKTVARRTLTPVTARCVHTLSDGDTGRETAPALILICTHKTLEL